METPPPVWVMAPDRMQILVTSHQTLTIWLHDVSAEVPLNCSGVLDDDL